MIVILARSNMQFFRYDIDKLCLNSWQTLCILLDKGGVGLKAFVPQLQTTFVKSLSDPAKQVLKLFLTAHTFRFGQKELQPWAY